jgi:hypothetical protein
VIPNGLAQSGQKSEGDTVDSSIEDIVGGKGADRLLGAPGVGNLIQGGPGNDRIEVSDSTADGDEVSCKDGVDSVRADGLDLVRSDCEKVARDGRFLVMSQRRGHAVKKDGSRYMRVAIRCGSKSDVRCSGSVKITPAGKKLLRVQGHGVKINPGRVKTVRLRIPSGKPKRVTVTVALRDGGGHANYVVKTYNAPRHAKASKTAKAK